MKKHIGVSALLILVVLLAASCGGGAPAASGADGGWSLTVESGGATKTFTLEQLKALPATEVKFLAKETGAENTYQGVALKDLVAAVGADVGAITGVDVEAEDAFVATVSQELVANGSAVLVYGMDGGTLPAEMGTVRVLVPGEATKLQVKFVKKITVK